MISQYIIFLIFILFYVNSVYWNYDLNSFTNFGKFSTSMSSNIYSTHSNSQFLWDSTIHTLVVCIRSSIMLMFFSLHFPFVFLNIFHLDFSSIITFTNYFLSCFSSAVAHWLKCIIFFQIRLLLFKLLFQFFDEILFLGICYLKCNNQLFQRLYLIALICGSHVVLFLFTLFFPY